MEAIVRGAIPNSRMRASRAPPAAAAWTAVL